MKSMFPKLSAVGVSLTLFAVLFALTGTAPAQSKKGPPAKKTVAKKNEKASKDARKDRDAAKSAKNAKDKNKKNNKAEKLAANKKSKEKANDRDKDRAKSDEKRSKNDKKAKAESKKEAAERRRAEAERRAAIQAELRRREQARREAIARKLAFERGLRIETIANIAKDNTDGEDLRIRSAAVNALGDHAGSVVVMEAQTGKVLTIVNQDWAVRTSIRPCSTIKLVTAAAGLNEGVINKEDGSVRNVSTRRKLDDAIAFSDNGYFQRVGSSLGNQKLVEYGRKLGLGELTGLNIEGETAGRLPYNNNNARIYSHGDDTEVSTVQLAVMASAITNGGHRVLPRIPRNQVDQARFQPFYKANVDLPQQNVRRMIPGMMGAAEYGTARRGMDQNLGVAGKTGSCIDKGSWVGLFASVAPIEQPKYAVAVITRGQRERGRAAAAVAAQIYHALGSTIVRTDRNLAQTEFRLRPRIGVDPSAAAAADAEEEDDDAGMAGVDLNGREIVVVPSANRDATVSPLPAKKLVTRTGSSKPTSKPVFPPVVITYDKSGSEIKPGIRKPE